MNDTQQNRVRQYSRLFNILKELSNDKQKWNTMNYARITRELIDQTGGNIPAPLIQDVIKLL